MVTQGESSSKVDKVKPLKKLILREKAMNRYFLKWWKRAATVGRLKPLKEQNPPPPKKKAEEKIIKRLHGLPPEKKKYPHIWLI